MSEKIVLNGQENLDEKVILVKSTDKGACQISGAIGSLDHAFGLQEVQNRYSKKAGKCCDPDVKKNGNKIDLGCDFKVNMSNKSFKKQILIEVETFKSYKLEHSLRQFLNSDVFVISNVKGMCYVPRTKEGKKAMEVLGIRECDKEVKDDIFRGLNKYQQKVLRRASNN